MSFPLDFHPAMCKEEDREVYGVDSVVGGQRLYPCSPEGSGALLREAGLPRLIRVDYHGPKEVPTGTCHAILKAAGIPKPGTRPPREQPSEEQSEEEQP